jgi:hypothetical protein
MQNYNSNLKTDLKRRAYHYALDIIRFLKECPNDIISQELKRQLIRDATNVPREKVESLLQETVELSKILGASILTLKGKR